MNSRGTRRWMAAVLVAGILLAGGLLLPIVTDAEGQQDTRIPFPPPSSHQGRWLEFHGRSVGAGGGSALRPEAECLICHDRKDCTGCHSIVPPRDHTNFWRTRSHGLMAAGNRERCQTCHRQDYCIRCHSETAPRTHTAGWRARHCDGCHFSGVSVPGEGCGVCHRMAPHTSAPHPVGPTLDCRLCH